MQNGQLKEWLKGICPICGKTFEYLITYDNQMRPHHPITCGKYECIKEANKRNMLYRTIPEA